ncbi:nucleoside triphosphate pyrophosphohydrolase [Sulfuriroseicoccus oceanibius]|uniref:Nucleoside triphosphate pyrophosphohydrolase n=1 Tax=Sulfuriroseicoccus oceanibius TaxID=2707525 RepID=A0A6B3L4J2_9BACT|nr:nucleoside triphosphate pyrophosphohydrolase [Sulfuriroseicoccus oceanibius]QQL45162.1 nucleoside triphosphate pyrophosphohydrolase [Sulfuriroseicoccus oceanibius]
MSAPTPHPDYVSGDHKFADAQLLTDESGVSGIDRLRAIMHRLRAPGGCPWDAEQTHASLVSNLLEEAYEVVDTIQRDDIVHLREELGDLLLQVVFHSELAEEAGTFDFDQVAHEISDKLVRRHPHVFARAEANDSEAVLNQWDAIKREEKGHQKKPYLHGVGDGLPALMRAAKLQKKAAKVGFDWRDAAEVIDKIDEELDEVREHYGDDGSVADRAGLESEIGDLLFSVVNLARKEGLDPEVLMAAANEKFARRFDLMEGVLSEQEETLEEASLETMEAAWQFAKERA